MVERPRIFVDLPSMLKDFLNTSERKTATWIKRFDDASVEERVILLENLNISNEHSNAITDEIECRLKEIVRSNPSDRCTELAIKSINDTGIESLFTKPLYFRKSIECRCHTLKALRC